ncbi:hypothetical protein [Pontibacter akesuensis]|uniref:hypothetical protein n=1 Tax=Pontibacter akesuensis TaxID=388950 RepID=UPI0012FC773A|nr:hypothetical protein [Pontibacter akesuensis]
MHPQNWDRSNQGQPRATQSNRGQRTATTGNLEQPIALPGSFRSVFDASFKRMAIDLSYVRGSVKEVVDEL